MVPHEQPDGARDALKLLSLIIREALVHILGYESHRGAHAQQGPAAREAQGERVFLGVHDPLVATAHLPYGRGARQALRRIEQTVWLNS